MARQSDPKRGFDISFTREDDMVRVSIVEYDPYDRGERGPLLNGATAILPPEMVCALVGEAMEEGGEKHSYWFAPASGVLGFQNIGDEGHENKQECKELGCFEVDLTEAQLDEFIDLQSRFYDLWDYIDDVRHYGSHLDEWPGKAK